MKITTYQLNKIIQHIFSGTTYTPVATWYLGLSTTAIDETGATVTEPTDAAYARVAITNNGTEWVVTGTDGEMENANDADFPQSTESWGNIASIFLADASTAGNVCYFADASPIFPVPVNTVVSFAAGKIVASLS